MAPETERQIYRITLRCLLMTAGIGLAMLALWQMMHLLVLAFGAIVIAVLLRSIADPIASHTPLGSRASVAVAVLIVLAVVGVFVWIFGNQLQGQLANLSETLPSAWRDFRERIETLPGVSELLGSLQENGPASSDVISRISSVLMAFGSAIADLLLIVFGAIFLAAQPSLYRSGLVKLFPAQARTTVSDALDESEHALRWWLLGQLVSMVMVGMLTWLGLWLIGLPSPLALGMIAGLAEIVPYAGPVIAAVPGLLLALLQGPEMALWALFVYIAVQQLEGALIMPVVQRKAVRLPPALTVFGVIAAGLVFGLVGFIFAAPILVVAYVLVKRLYVKEALHTDTALPGDQQHETG